MLTVIPRNSRVGGVSVRLMFIRNNHSKGCWDCCCICNSALVTKHSRSDRGYTLDIVNMHVRGNCKSF